MRQKLIYKILITTILLSLAACSNHKIETLGYVPKLDAVSSARNLNNELTNIAIVPTIGQAALIGASELSKHQEKMPKNIVVTSTVNINDFKQSSNFGRLFSESMIANFKRLGWNVIDFRGQFPTIKEREGEFYLSRKDLKKIPLNSVVFVATYGEYQNGLLINMRILDEHNTVMTASNVQLNDPEALALSKRSNCKTLGCSNNTQGNSFSISLKQDDCSNANRCECSNPNTCLGEKYSYKCEGK